jgi:chemotaxis protein methyltransferase CheR
MKVDGKIRDNNDAQPQGQQPQGPWQVPPLSDGTFLRFRDLIYRETGICMRESKRILVSNRLRKRILALGLKTYDEYYDLLTNGKAEEELPHFIDAVSTNETYFFRGDNQFDALSQVILPELYAKRSHVKIWSAGCSTGEEPYTICIVALETAAAMARGVTFEVIATDINTDVIARSRQGVYKGRTLKFMPPALISRYMLPCSEGEYMVGPDVKKKVTFKVHNLLKQEPPAFGVDVIFCRNVMIYFDRQTQKYLVDSVFARALHPNGYLLIGHSESLIGKSDEFQYAHIMKAPIYRKRAAGRGGDAE